MNNTTLYSLGVSFARGSLHVDPQNVDHDHLLLFMGKITPRKPIICLYNSGTRPMDLIGTTWGDMKIISGRFWDLLKSHKFTGWSSYPVEVYGKKKILIPGYHGLTITGRSGPFDTSIAVRTIRPPHYPGGPPCVVNVGVQIDPTTWDGSDLFIPEGTSALIVVEAVRDAIVSSGLTNVRLTRLSEREVY